MLVLERMGSFFVGGRRVRVSGKAKRKVSYSSNVVTEYDPNGTFLIEQAYVQYFLPRERRFRTSLLLVHGGGLTGAQWEDTPDGRPGWLARLLEAQIAVYVIDNVERGRAGWCAIEGEWQESPVVRSDEEAARFYRFAYPNNQFPLEHLDQLSAQTVPRWPSTYPLQIAALSAAIARIGPVILVGFSQGGGLSFIAADRDRDRVKASSGSSHTVCRLPTRPAFPVPPHSLCWVITLSRTTTGETWPGLAARHWMAGPQRAAVPRCGTCRRWASEETVI